MRAVRGRAPAAAVVVAAAAVVLIRVQKRSVADFASHEVRRCTERADREGVECVELFLPHL